MLCKYPEIEVQLVGNDGNAFSILENVKNALRKNKVPNEEINQFIEEATNEDYNHLLRTCMNWVTVL